MRNKVFTLTEVLLPHPTCQRKFAFTLAEVLLPHPNSQPKFAFTLAEFFLPHPTCQRKFAFTLAEVLITLGIIGVVAALTMPALIASYQKMVLKQQFKKSYSLLTQYFNKVVADFDGSIPQCYYVLDSNDNLAKNATAVDCKAVRDSLFKNLIVIKTCEDKSYDRGCIPKYKGFDTMSIENNPDKSEEDAIFIVRGQPGFYQNAILNTNASYVLADGTIILDYGVGHFPRIFAVDINGKKGPNKWGYDVFSYWAGSNDKRGYYLYPTSYLVEKGGLTTIEKLKEVYK